MPPMSQLDWLSSTTAMIVVFWSRATRDLLKSFGWGIAALHRLHAATKLPFPRRPPHRISPSHPERERSEERHMGSRTAPGFGVAPSEKRNRSAGVSARHRPRRESTPENRAGQGQKRYW